ncbi:MAG: hypothetical protein JNM84_23520 [Planctomycetes bacterium]|nr:hypothetical protein [Planctomycetota bacterium]
MSDSQKPFDCVLMMRAIRDQIAAETADMDDDEFERWLAETPLEDPELERLRVELESRAEERPDLREAPTSEIDPRHPREQRRRADAD